VKDKTIEQLAAALQARDDALEKHVATVQALRVRRALMHRSLCCALTQAARMCTPASLSCRLAPLTWRLLRSVAQRLRGSISRRAGCVCLIALASDASRRRRSVYRPN